MLDLKQTKTFLTIAETGSFSKAAEELDIAQPTVSLHIKSLEKSLGYNLYDRIGKYAIITPEGEKFLPSARELLRIAQEAKSLGTEEQHLSGSLTLCIVQSVCTYLMPPILKKFHTTYPNVDIRITVNRPSVYMLEQLRSGDFDIAIVLENRFDIPSLVAQPLWSDQLKVVTYPHHKLAKKKKIDLALLEQECFVLPQQGAHYRKLFERRLREDGVVLTNIIEVDNIEAIKQLVKEGLGLAILPSYAIQAEIASGTLKNLDIDGRELKVTSQVIWHKDKLMRACSKAFINMLSSEFNHV